MPLKLVRHRRCDPVRSTPSLAASLQLVQVLIVAQQEVHRGRGTRVERARDFRDGACILMPAKPKAVESATSEASLSPKGSGWAHRDPAHLPGLSSRPELPDVPRGGARAELGALQCGASSTMLRMRQPGDASAEQGHL